MEYFTTIQREEKGSRGGRGAMNYGEILLKSLNDGPISPNQEEKLQ